MSRARTRDDRGAVAPLMALVSVVLLLVASLAVDLGLQRVVRRDMQGLADLVALDLAREIDGRSQAELEQLTNTRDPGSVLSRILARNDTTLGDAPRLDVDWGAWRRGTFDTSVDPPTAVQVTASSKVGFGFATGSGSATRTAYAEASSTACHSLGSFAARITSSDSSLLAPLNDLLDLDLDLLSYRALAAVEVSLADLVATGKVGTETELLTGQVSFLTLVEATISALNRATPTGHAAAVSVLSQRLLAVAGTVPAVRLGSLLNIAPSDSAALVTGLNVLDLLSGSILVASGRHALEIPKVHQGVPGMGNKLDGSLYVQQGRQLACGAPGSAAARATASQLGADLEIEFVNLPSLRLDLGLVRGTLQTAKAPGRVRLNLGNATSQMPADTTVHCGDGTLDDPTTFGVDVANGLAAYTLSADVTISGRVRIGSVRVSVDLGVRLSLDAPAPGDAERVDLRLPPNDTVPVTTGSEARLLSSSLPSGVRVEVLQDVRFGGTGGLAGGLLTSLLGVVGDLTNGAQMVVDASVRSLTQGNNNFVDKTMRPLAANLDSQLVAPLAGLLGLRAGGADVYAVDALCGLPALRG